MTHNLTTHILMCVCITKYVHMYILVNICTSRCTHVNTYIFRLSTIVPTNKLITVRVIITTKSCRRLRRYQRNIKENVTQYMKILNRCVL
jgi:hypothetical protein